MKFMTFVKSAEDYGDPPQALMDAMGKYIEQNLKSGTLVTTGGLARSADGFRVRSSGGKLQQTDGPFSEAKEVVGGYAILELRSVEAAREVAREFMQMHVEHWPEWEGESEVRPIVFETGR
ncbi:MAG TPA: YciI family protein [Chloroflexota bacterium]